MAVFFIEPLFARLVFPDVFKYLQRSRLAASFSANRSTAGGEPPDQPCQQVSAQSGGPHPRGGPKRGFCAQKDKQKQKPGVFSF